jgi:hypothetical protein
MHKVFMFSFSQYSYYTTEQSSYFFCFVSRNDDHCLHTLRHLSTTEYIWKETRPHNNSKSIVALEVILMSSSDRLELT